MRVVNKKTEKSRGGRYIGRSGDPVVGKWGNPYILGKYAAKRVVVVREYCFHLLQTRLWKQLDELRGKDLVCSCSPELCHGHLLVHLTQRGCDEEYLRWLGRLDDAHFLIAIGYSSQA